MPRRVTSSAPPWSGPDAEASLGQDLDRLVGMDAAGLRRRWRNLVGRSPPDQLSPAVLLRALAYRVQANALGDLDRETRRALDRLATGVGEAIPLPEHRPTKPGTLLVREWQGTMHSVMVLQDGFAWNGQTFDSLSKVAHAITGTKWNGPRFFGLRDGARGSGRAAR